MSNAIVYPNEDAPVDVIESAQRTHRNWLDSDEGSADQDAFADELSRNHVPALLRELVALRDHVQVHAKWVGMPEDAPLLDIACEVTSVLETPIGTSERDALAAQVETFEAWCFEAGYDIRSIMEFSGVK